MHVSGVRQLVVAEFVHESGFDSDAVVRAGEEELHQKISRGTAYLPIFAYREILEKGHTLAMMGDRPLSEKFAWLPFLGKLAAFDLTPYRLAMTLKVPVVFCLAAKTGNKTYHFALHPCDPPTEVISKDDSSIQMAAAFALNLEKFIYLHPQQWFNFFSFFEGVSPPVVTR
jgi:predicted LPLAT superfamily acyltransferase